MKKIFTFLIILFFFLVIPKAHGVDQELLTSGPWNLTGNNGASERYQSIPANSLNGKTHVRLTYDLNGHCVLGGDASAIIFDQNGWKYISLSNYGTNCTDGQQVIEIPLSAFGVDTNANVGTFHGRFWKTGAYQIDVTSAVLFTTATPTPTPTPTATPTAIPTLTVTPTPTPIWKIRSVDAMKVTKDVICAQKDSTYISNWVDKAVEIGATHVAISQPYENPTCGNSIAYAQEWVDVIRAKGLRVWHRHMPLSFEGIYSTPKSNTDYYFETIFNYIANNSTLFAAGDIFTPIPEPQNGGIKNVTNCFQNVCQFESQKDFNNWLKTAMFISEKAFEGLGYAEDEIKIGYFGFDGFVVWGACNPDWNGILTDTTVARMGNITIDHYECGGQSMLDALTNESKSFRQKYPNTPLVIGEWGTIGATSEQDQVNQIHAAYDAFIQAGVIGVNYWHLGPGTTEGLINTDFSNKPGFNALSSYFTN